ncbi:MAG: PAS domain-containing protein [Pseudomonadota bacterium]
MSTATTVQQEAEQLILEKYGLPSVIINRDMQILQFRGQTGPYIQPSAGSASLNLLKMARPDLVLELCTLVQQAIKQHSAMRKEGVQLRENDSCRKINLQVLPLSHAEVTTPNYLVLFESGTEAAVVRKTEGLAPDAADAKSLRIQELENELLAEREYMQSIIENQEATNEELQSANEEIQSANEELQSTNEELETAKEELQSTNEELATIIEEHENRNQELNRVNNDFSNLLASIELAIVILHADLRIRRFTPAAKTLLNLIDTDIGRPIGNIRPNFELPGLEQRVRQVIDTMVPQSVELRDHDGHWYVLRLRPYRTLDNRIEGAVLAFIGIDSIKDAEHLRQALRQERRLAVVARNSSDAITLQDFTGHILAWNQRAAEMYGYSEEEALRLNAAALIPDEVRADMHMLWERLRHGEKAPPCESRRRARDGRIFKVWLTTSALLDEAGNPSAIALTERELT